MQAKQPTLAELIEALPPDAENAAERAPARVELEELLSQMGKKPIPTGRLSRLWSMGTLQAKITAAYLAWWLRSGFQDAEARQRGLDETHVTAAIQVLNRMTYLRGAFMKLGQILAHWPDVMPGPFVDILGCLHSEAPPMHFALLREHVRRELGADPMELFDDFETEAFAAASLGQVHRARLKGTDRRVAIKIQYPDIGRTIASDLRNLKAASFGMRLTGDWDNLLLQFEGIQNMLQQETDYALEARTLKTARETLADLDGVVVPEVIDELSTDRVLTMEYIEGLHLDAFLETKPAQDVRDRHGALMSRASHRLWYTSRMVYADPHPGNYLFMPDGRLGLIDFGCCHHFTDEEYAYVLDMERAVRNGDEEAMLSGIAFGCDLAPEDFSPERLALMHEYCEWIWAPLRNEGPFDYGDTTQFSDGIRLYGEFVKRRWVRSQPVNVWLTKVFYGLRAMLTHLKARVDYRKIMYEESTL